MPGPEGSSEIDPRVVDALKRKPRTDFGQLHAEEISESVDRATRYDYREPSFSERVATEEAVEHLSKIINADEGEDQ